MKKEYLIEELEFCLKQWEEKGYCDFGGKRECPECGSPYLTYKMLTGEDAGDDLSLKEWKEKLKEIKENSK